MERDTMAIMAISVTPVGTGSPSVGDYVAEAVRVIQRSGLRYELGAMHTVVEGDLDAMMRLVPEIHEACVARGARRLSTVIKIDDRRDGPSSIAAKVRAVRDRLERASP
jgi:uncharacterized protein (TIGR00106 family)